MDYVGIRLEELLESIDAFKKPTLLQKALPFFTHVLPVVGMLLVLWLHRPEWLREQDPDAERQLFKSLGEWLAFIHIAGATSFVGVIGQAARLRFSPSSRNRAQFAWLLCLLVFFAIAVHQLNGLYQFY